MDNIEIKDDAAIIRLNPKIYPLEVIYGAAYIMMDRASILLDGDPEKEILVSIKSKDGNLEKNIKEFNDELVTYSVHRSRSEETLRFRNTILQSLRK